MYRTNLESVRCSGKYLYRTLASPWSSGVSWEDVRGEADDERNECRGDEKRGEHARPPIDV
jgi:hypothetical protein